MMSITQTMGYLFPALDLKNICKNPAALTVVMKSEHVSFSKLDGNNLENQTSKLKVHQSDAVVKLCNGLPREVASSPLMEIVKT